MTRPTLVNELYDSNQNPARDNPGGAVKYALPTVLNGKVYVGAVQQVSVYGLFSFQASTPVFSPAGGTYTSTQTVSISDSTPEAIIYYTLDGSDPTTSSPVYSSPVNVSQTTTVNAMAVRDWI